MLLGVLALDDIFVLLFSDLSIILIITFLRKLRAKYETV